LRFHRQHHRDRTDNQDGSVDRSHPDIELLASGGEGVEVREAVNKIGAEHPAEKHDFSHDEEPHAERGSVFLLLRVGEVVAQRRIVRFVVDGGDRTGI